MADQKLTAIRAAKPFVSPLAADDLLYIVQDTGTTPEERAITGAELEAELKTYFDTLYPIKLAGDVVQSVYTTNTTKTTGTTLIPLDDTIPQNTEGDEIMTLAITPTSATNRLVIEAIIFANPTAINYIVGCLFQDTTAGALRVAPVTAAAAYYSEIVLRHEMAAGTTSPTTFRIRCGGTNADTITYNGRAGNRQFGGALASSIRITEIQA